MQQQKHKYLSFPLNHKPEVSKIMLIGIQRNTTIQKGLNFKSLLYIVQEASVLHILWKKLMVEKTYPYAAIQTRND